MIQENILICEISEVEEILQKEKFYFLEKVLLAMNLPVHQYFPEGLEEVFSSVQERIKLRSFLISFGQPILYSEDQDGGIEVFLGTQKIAALNSPQKSLIFDLEKKKTLYRLVYQSPISVFGDKL